MARWKIVAGLFLAGAVLFIFAAAVRMARGGGETAAFFGIGATFFALAAVFIALSAGRTKRTRESDSSPPAA